MACGLRLFSTRCRRATSAARQGQAIRFFSVACAILIFGANVSDAKTLNFAGRTWTVRPSGDGSPGPKGYTNHWSEDNAWVDSSGRLHLKIGKMKEKWCCAEVFSNDKVWFGLYQWYVTGRIDRLDKNVVLGLFPYLGPAGRNEIDIETTAWGNVNNDRGNFTVWPTKSGLPKKSRTFPFSLNGDCTTHRFNWQSASIFFQMLHGHRTDNDHEIANWKFTPARHIDDIPQQAMRTHMNLWLFTGSAPSDGREVEIIIKGFQYGR